MNETLKALYDSFYQPLDLTAEKQEIEARYQQLIERLDKPERKLVLWIIDAKDRSAELLSIDSFICGFELACKLVAELDHYKQKTSARYPRKLDRALVLPVRIQRIKA